MAARIEIKQYGMFTKVFIDGEELQGVRGISFKRGLEAEIPVVSLDLQASNMTIDTHVMLELPKPYADYYVRKPYEE